MLLEFSFNTTRHVKRNILHILSGLDRGGIETWLQNLFRESPEIRDRTVICLTGPVKITAEGYYREVSEMGIPWVSIPYTSGLGRIVFLVKLAKYIFKEKIKCVHVHMNHLSGIGVLAAYLGRAKTRIAHHHLPLPPCPGKLWRSFTVKGMQFVESLFSTHIVGCSKFVLDSIDKEWSQDQRKKLIYCGINLREQASDVDSSSLKKELAIPSHARVVGHVGTFRKQKNHSFFVLTAAEIAARSKDIYFLLVGDGPLRPQLEKAISRFELKNQFILTGARGDIPGLLSVMDVFLFPSLYEGFGLVLLEAQAAGIPCIVSDTVPREAEVVPGLVRFLPLERGPVYWAEQVLEAMLLERPPREECLAIIEARGFSIEKSASRLKEIYGI